MLTEHYSVYTYDRRGRGESGDTKPYAVDREIEDIEALIDHAGGKAYLFGVSSGAALSLRAAAKLGADKVSKLALYDPPYGQPQRDFAEQKARVSELVRTGQPGDAAAYFLHAAAGRIASLVPEGRHTTIKGQAHGVTADATVPVLVEFFGKAQ